MCIRDRWGRGRCSRSNWASTRSAMCLPQSGRVVNQEKIRPDKSSVKERAEPVAAGCPARPRSSTSTGTMLGSLVTVSYTHLRAHETVLDLVCRLLLEKKKKN